MSENRNSEIKVSDVAALFDGGRLTLARHLSGMRKTELATKIEKSPSAVAAWESGASRPTASNVAQLAICLAVEPGFFSVRALQTSFNSTPHFRSLRSTSQVARDQARGYGQLAVEIMHALERHVELPTQELPSLPVAVDSTEGDGPERAAQLVRKEWELEYEPIGHLIRLVEKHGVLVVFSPLQVASVDAYSFDSRLRPVIILNPNKRDYYRQRFDVAHELGHLVMHADAEPGGQIVEEQANRFAAEFLMPSGVIGDMLPVAMNGNAWPTLGGLKEHWGVSIQALLFHARRLGRLSDVSYRNAMTTISTRGWRRDEPGLVKTIEQPSLLARAVEILDQSGMGERLLLDECRVPLELFRAVTSRTPRDAMELNGVAQLLEMDRIHGGKVTSLLEWRADAVASKEN